MLLVDFQASGDDDIDGRLLDKVLTSASSDKVVLLSEIPVPSGKTFPGIEVRLALSREGNARNHDLRAIYACLTLLGESMPIGCVKVFADGSIETVSEPIDAVTQELLHRAVSTFAQEGHREQAKALRDVRSVFRQLSGENAAILNTELRYLGVLLDTVDAFFHIPRPDTLDALANAPLLDDWKQFTDGYLAYTTKVLLDCPEIEPRLRDCVEFFKLGARLRSSAVKQADTGTWCSFFAWLSAYFVQSAAAYIRGRDYTASICCSIRALESYATMWALSDNILKLDPAYGIQFPGGSRPEGLRGIWAHVYSQVAPQLTQQQSDIVGKVTKIIFIRNHASLTHGVQHASEATADDCLSVVRDSLFFLEKIGGDTKRPFAGSLQLSSTGLAAAAPKSFMERALEQMTCPVGKPDSLSPV